MYGRHEYEVQASSGKICVRNIQDEIENVTKAVECRNDFANAIKEFVGSSAFHDVDNYDDRKTLFAMHTSLRFDVERMLMRKEALINELERSSK